jgi:hypothetical protein
MLEANGRNPSHADWQSITARSARPPESLPEAGLMISNDLRSLATNVEGAGNLVQRYLTEQVRDRPFAMLTVAAGLGYLLAGGLGGRTTPLLFAVATRLARNAMGSSFQQRSQAHSRSEHEHR